LGRESKTDNSQSAVPSELRFGLISFSCSSTFSSRGTSIFGAVLRIVNFNIDHPFEKTSEAFGEHMIAFASNVQ